MVWMGLRERNRRKPKVTVVSQRGESAERFLSLESTSENNVSCVTRQLHGTTGLIVIPKTMYARTRPRLHHSSLVLQIRGPARHRQTCRFCLSRCR